MKSILIIDDEPDIVALVSLCLDNIQVLPASGLRGALDVARVEEIGLVLLDLALGGEDGLQILPFLREEPSLSSVPIIAFTAHASRRGEALECGVDYFLSRPFLTVELRTTVEHHLVR